MSNAALQAYAKRDDLSGYGNNGLLLFALQLQLGLDDIESVAADSLTDGSNDKKCDLVYVDRERARLIVAQGYMAKPGSAAIEAPANKAADLNTAVAWLLSGELENLPQNLRSAAVQAREAVTSQAIRSIDLWYVHNLKESFNVKRELNQAAKTAKGIIDTYFRDSQVSSIVGREIGISAFADMYKRTQAPIVVTDTYDVPVTDGFEVRSAHWKSYCTSVPGSWLREIWRQHEVDLLSPNVRDYLGIIKTERNINHGIKISAREEPQEFWIFNNGITILVNDYEYTPKTLDSPLGIRIKAGGTLRVDGIGIVNGAQTTGSIGTLTDLEASEIDNLMVMARFVKCDDQGILADIVKYNNTQNKVEAADFRSKDSVQERLRAEFECIPDAAYRGGRRGGVRDAIERQKNLVADSAVAQALAAFQGEPNLAYNELRRIWDNDGTYARFFNEKTTARHIVFAYSLLKAIEVAKRDISDLSESARTKAQNRQMNFFRQRGSIQLLLSAIAESLETILGRAVPDRFSLHFGASCSPRTAAQHWSPIVSACLPFSDRLQDAADRNLQNMEKVRSAIQTFQSLVEATTDANERRYSEFAKLVKVD